MEVFDAIKLRRSIRKYKPSAIPDEHLKKILEAARLAPSAGNRQPWRFIIVRSSEGKKLLAEAARNQMFLEDAGVIIVALADTKTSPRWCKQDTMIAVENMVLASTSLGYGTCWIGAFEEERIKRLLGIPEKMVVVALLPIGVPDENPQPRPRKDFNEIFFEEKYGKHLTF
ncbi:nitroreductase [Candidatus Bathyarchaeota archaeon]|nr:MAG: nitroreductase [Candidatus Bathyarchaeota archaeon]